MDHAAISAKQTAKDTARANGRGLRRAFALVALVAISVATPCWAQTQSTSTDRTAADKALRGLANIMTGVMVLPGEIRKEWNEGGPGMGLTVGVAQGLSMIVARELIGVFELLTSPTPWPKDDFDPILRPEFPWHYFRD